MPSVEGSQSPLLLDKNQKHVTTHGQGHCSKHQYSGYYFDTTQPVGRQGRMMKSLQIIYSFKKRDKNKIAIAI